IATENDAYRSAFHKALIDPHPVFTPEEQHALLRFKQLERAAQSTSNSEGGYAIPVFIDPSYILTDQETDNPFLALARIVDIQSNKWKGVSGAGVQWSFDAETSEVSADGVGLSQPVVDVHTARGFIPFSLEIGEDWPGFQAE